MNRFIRLDTVWSTSAWLSVLAAEARLCWIELLCYVKGHGRNGRAKALHPLVASRMWFVGEEAVRQLLMAAEKHGAISIVEQDWVVAKWEHYQGDTTNAERQARFRDKKVTGSNALRNARNTEKEKDSKRERITNPPKSPLPGDLPVSLESVSAKLIEYVQHRKEKREPLTPTAWKNLVSKLEKWGPERALVALEHSVSSGYSGVFEPRESSPKPQSQLKEAQLEEAR